MNRSILKLTLFAIAGLAMLVALGSWQLQRLAWKEGLIARVEARAHSDPVGLAEALRREKTDGDIEYLRVRMQGHFLNDKERHLYTVLEGRPGWRVITPLETGEGAIVMVDRGFVPEGLKDASKRSQGLIEGETTVTGLARAPGEANPFTPESDWDRNRWFWRDLHGMADSILVGDRRERLVPFFVEAEASPVPGGWPRGGVTRIDFPNRHLEYAVTWFGLALALFVVYAAILRRWWRQGEFT
jgi:surfeit locus 1 family protein